MSRKDQKQYWAVPDRPYRYIPVGKFAESFGSYRLGKNLTEEMNIPFDRRYNHPAALSTSQYGVKRRELLKTNFDWQLLIMKRNSFIYVFKFIQVNLLLHILRKHSINIKLMSGNCTVIFSPCGKGFPENVLTKCLFSGMKA